MFHSLYLLLFMATAAPLVSYVPLAVLGAILTVVAWNMCEKDEFIALLKSSRGDAVVLLATFLLTVFVDLPTAIAVGVVLGSFLFLHRMAEAVEVEGGEAVIEDRADTEDVSATKPNGMKDDSIRLSHLRRAVLRRDRGGQHDPRPDRPASARVHSGLSAPFR